LHESLYLPETGPGQHSASRNALPDRCARTAWGVEIYDLLTRWNPLRARQWLPKRYNGLKVMICGMGPAGFTLAHHLLMEGFAVVGVDGLKIEPLARQLVEKPIEDYAQLEEELDERVMTGFGGVAEPHHCSLGQELLEAHLSDPGPA